MNSVLSDIPLWAAIPAAIFIVLGGILSVTGAIGLARLQSFYDRIHAPTLATSWGAGSMVMASIIVLTVLSGRLALQPILIGIFITVTTPITLMLLARAALYRDRTEGSPDVPPAFTPPPADDSDEPEIAAGDGQASITQTN